MENACPPQDEVRVRMLELLDSLTLARRITFITVPSVPLMTSE